MEARNVTYSTAGKALEVNANFFGSALEKNDSEPFFCLKAYTYGYNGQERDDEIKGSGNSYNFGARIQDPRLGIFLSVDPRTSDLPSFSPYSYAVGNPIIYLDPDGEYPITFHVRSFAPFDYFGAGLWKGDGKGRPFSTSSNYTSRIRQVTNYETTTMAKSHQAHGNWSHSRYGANAFSDAEIYDQSWGNRILTRLSGDNDAFVPGIDYGGPTHDIDVWTDVFVNVTEFDDGSSKLNINGRVQGDGFPSSEAFVSDQSGTSIFLGVGAAQAGPNEGPFVTLAGDKKQKQFDININISVDSDGNFNGVYSTDSDGNEIIMSPEAWNAQFENKDPKGD